MARAALVDDLLDAEAVALELADGLRVEGSLLGEAAEGFEEPGAQSFLPALDVRGRLERGDLLPARVEQLARLALQLGVKDLARRRLASVGLQDGQILIGDGPPRGGEEGQNGETAHGGPPQSLLVARMLMV
jgi:hypothetical protein